MAETPKQTAARYDKPNTPRYNLMTALQALSQKLPEIPLARTTGGVTVGKGYTLPDIMSDLVGLVAPESAAPIEHFSPLDDIMPIMGGVLGAMKMRPRPMAAKSRLVDDMGDLDPNRGKAEWLGGDPDYSRIRGIYDPDTDTIGLNRDLWMGADQQSRMGLLRHEDGHAVWGNLSKESQAEMDMWAKDFQQSRRDGGYLDGEGPDAPTNGQELWAEIWRAAQTGEGWDEYAGVFDHHVKEAIRGPLPKKAAGPRLNFNERAAMQGLDPKRPWYHGSLKRMEGDYFDPSMGGEAYYGKGIYLTDNELDASNYASMLHGDNKHKYEGMRDIVENQYRDFPDSIYNDFTQEEITEVARNYDLSPRRIREAYEQGDMQGLFDEMDEFKKTVGVNREGVVVGDPFDDLAKRDISKSGFGPEHATVQKLLARVDDLNILNHNVDVFEGEDLDRLIETVVNKSDEYGLDPTFAQTVAVEIMEEGGVTPFRVQEIMEQNDFFDQVYMSPWADPESGPFPGDFFQEVWGDMGYDAVEMDPGKTFGKMNFIQEGLGKMPVSEPGSQHLVIFQKTVDDVSRRDPVKSFTAKLNPDKQYSRNLMAGMGGAAVGLSQLTKKQRDQEQ